MTEDIRRKDPPSADEAVAKLRLLLRDRSLAQLEEEGMVIWDRDEHTVKRGPNFDEKKIEND